ncbi:hypothetical protein PoB_005707000 [Plakobranchus ocellatus]|uniref:Uncharacterized protein n=1 Tax=Plakobranchus ocellatus TaxID=259542 RepID=A0AAV4CCT6_9GAST|nr:hypothetical protein PoB_005707000 [Plakobranchus ocellatus]
MRARFVRKPQRHDYIPCSRDFETGSFTFAKDVQNISRNVKKESGSHACSKHRGTRRRILIILGKRHTEVVCHCFPRRLYFRRVLRELATPDRRAMKLSPGPDWDSNLGHLTWPITAHPQQGDLRLSATVGPGRRSGARTRCRQISGSTHIVPQSPIPREEEITDLNQFMERWSSNCVSLDNTQLISVDLFDLTVPYGC